MRLERGIFMNEQIQAVVDLLQAKNIDYSMIEHIPVYTIDEILALDLPEANLIAKNLFIRDDKKKNYYIIVVAQDKKVNLKALKEKLNSRPLGFVSEKDMWNILKLTKGAVTPFGILNDENCIVKVVIDKIFENTNIAVHPNSNTASVWLKTTDLISIIKEHGNLVEFMDI